MITLTDGVNRRLEHRAILRRSYIDAAQLIFSRDLAFNVFTNLAVDLAQFLADVARQILIDLDDLQLACPKS